MPRTKGAKGKAKATAPKLSFNERVRKVIAGEAETKMKVVNIFNQSGVTHVGLSQAAPVAGLINHNILETLAIDQGAEQEQREGNKISECRLTVRGVIASQSSTDNPATALNNPFEVHMVFFKEKKDIGNSVQMLKVLPNNNTGPIDGSLINSVYPYNKDRYIIRKVKVFRLRPVPGTATVLPGGDQPTLNTQLSNAPFFHRFVETIDIHKDLKFNDQATVPTNDWVGVGFFVINADGSTTLPVVGQARAEVTMDAVLRYKDM